MLTWQLDRMFRSAMGCFVAALFIAVTAAVVVAQMVDSNTSLGASIVSVLIMAVGGAAASMQLVGFGIAVFGFSVALAEPGTGWLVAIGVALFACLLLFDLSISLRRGPLVERGIWTDLIVSLLGVATAGTALAVLLWAVGRAREWPVIVVPVALATIGFALRGAAELHHRRVRSKT